MEFWGVEVKSGQPLDVFLPPFKVLHLSQACLGEIKDNKTNESVYLHIIIENKRLVLGTLNSERLPQQLFDLVIDKDCRLSHNWKNGSVYFYGYIVDQPLDDDTSGSEESDEDLPYPSSNGRQILPYQEAKKEDNPVADKKKESSAAAKKKEGKPRVKIIEPEKKSDEDDSDSDASDSMSGDSDSDEDDEDLSDSEDGSDEEEETPKTQQSGKKRPNESALKTPASDKKAKMSTPQKKTDGKKAEGHVATPHPSKPNKQVKSENKSNQKSPASASIEGAYSCKPCNRTFKSDSALQSHNQAKHK